MSALPPLPPPPTTLCFHEYREKLRANSSAHWTYRQDILNKRVSGDFSGVRGYGGGKIGRKATVCRTRHGSKLLPWRRTSGLLPRATTTPARPSDGQNRVVRGSWIGRASREGVIRQAAAASCQLSVVGCRSKHHLSLASQQTGWHEGICTIAVVSTGSPVSVQKPDANPGHRAGPGSKVSSFSTGHVEDGVRMTRVSFDLCDGFRGGQD